MKHKFGHEEKHGRHLVGNALCWVEVTCIESDHHVALGGIGCIEIVGAYCIALKTYTEHL